ncbi:TPA: hypothetical protein I8W54_002115 [Morganella morganii]|nr:hypothetical protein [Morganella morganii]HAT1528353.1 hypothetical protein [Morganella morganii]
MQKKIDLLRGYAKDNDWDSAIKLAGSFPNLGEHKKIITKAKEALLRPEFQMQLGKDPSILISEGVLAIKTRYKL